MTILIHSEDGEIESPWGLLAPKIPQERDLEKLYKCWHHPMLGSVSVEMTNEEQAVFEAEEDKIASETSGERLHTIAKNNSSVLFKKKAKRLTRQGKQVEALKFLLQKGLM